MNFQTHPGFKSHRYFGNYFIYDENCTFQNEKEFRAGEAACHFFVICYNSREYLSRGIIIWVMRSNSWECFWRYSITL